MGPQGWAFVRYGSAGPVQGRIAAGRHHYRGVVSVSALTARALYGMGRVVLPRPASPQEDLRGPLVSRCQRDYAFMVVLDSYSAVRRIAREERGAPFGCGLF
jgi:hypothetical protein